ncbi:hypothetical protein HNR03_004929 [Pseudomonas sp. JAI111]|uniref:hypothetical protein n=1 Tax=Pseudomonas sp. JAI111 TaxID=2735913 RepID=UPI00216703E3|nr:hypothetical protein [Pseudomonas sp. JAI111]MCS3840305.1 hypothetical protein [Pseudomonas sp. JAI111]
MEPDAAPKPTKALTPVSLDDHSQMFSSWLWQGTGSLNVKRLRAWLNALPSQSPGRVMRQD